MENNEYQDKIKEINESYDSIKPKIPTRDEQMQATAAKYRAEAEKEFAKYMPPLPRGKRYDERQLLIRGSIFTRGLIVTWVLILVNAILLEQFDYAAKRQFTYLIIIALSAAYIAVEMFRRGAFFDIRGAGLFSVSGIAAVSVFRFAVNVWKLFNGDVLFEDGKLSVIAEEMIYFFILTAVCVIGIRYQRKMKKAQKEEPEDEE
ncbi:MAG: hypothetical protein LBN00_08505 [Oscillospiraceae bacterium]|jgi:hypothetical protein|nr:hypothetical protein [Oscillospiraceae bacterium]